MTASKAILKNSGVELILGSALAVMSAPTVASDSNLLEPRELLADKSIPTAQLEAQVLAARRYDTFWSTGDESLARSALASDFTDRTLPPGRPQGIAGPLAASKAFHAAVPDLKCAIEQMLVVGDRVVTHLRFTGHFSGMFKEVQGSGQPIDFIATDIYRVKQGAITENWHLEDNLTLLTQLGLIKP